MNKVSGRLVLRGQGHENIGIHGSHDPRIIVGKVDAAVGQTYVVDDIGDLVRRNLLAG